MKHLTSLFLSIAASAIFFLSCNSKQNAADKYLDPRAQKIEVLEVLQTSQYTYLRGEVDGKDTWIAINKQEIEKGKTYYFIMDIEMENFVSRELKRTFESILFVQHFSADPILPQKGLAPGSKQLLPEKEKVEIAPAEGSITIGKLYAEKQQWAGKTVVVTGKVMKYNADIMGRNWIHLQDGTANGENYDLTLTSRDTVKVGDVVVMEGKVSLDKDFGAGYVYALIIEEAKLKGK